MNERLLRVGDRIRSEVEAIAGVVDRAEEGMQRALATRDPFYWDSVALSLHGFYGGLERLFQIVAATIDGDVPQSANWHQVLLEQMAREVPEVRPAVISDDTREALEEYRGFRHVVRNIYAFEFDPVQVRRLAEGASGVFIKASGELLAFADFLERHAEE